MLIRNSRAWFPPTLHQANDAGRPGAPSPCSLGNLSKPKELLHYLQPPFCITLYLQGTLNKQQQCFWSAQPNLSQEPAPVVFLSKGLSTPLLSLSINLLHLHGPPIPACSGPLGPTEFRSLLFFLEFGG